MIERIQQSGNIFWAWSDRKWLLEGAAVHVAMIAFDDGSESSRLLDGEPVALINPDLTTGANISVASQLQENSNLCFMGITRIGQFILDPISAEKMLRAPTNVNGRPNSDVVKPWVNAIDLTRRARGMFIIDFGVAMPLADAVAYEMPFEYVKHYVLPERLENWREAYRERWWIFGEARASLRKKIRHLHRYIATPMVSKHRVFAWIEARTIPENLVNVVARDDDYFFGILHSQAHETRALAQGTQLEDRPRYTPNSTFDTFPFPWPPGTEPAEDADPHVHAIAEAARELVRLRDAWLNPPGASEADLKTRTLTNLYNARPAWLANAHRTLDEAVFAAYGWSVDLSKQEILARLLALNHERAATQLPS